MGSCDEVALTAKSMRGSKPGRAALDRECTLR